MTRSSPTRSRGSGPADRGIPRNGPGRIAPAARRARFGYSHFGALLLLCAVASPALAADEPLPPSGNSRADRWHRSIGAAVSGFANRLDAFFGDERVDEESQRSRLRVRTKLGWVNGEGWRFSLPVRADLALPRMEERWDLFVDSMMDDDGDDAARTDLSSDLSDSVRLSDRSAFVGLRYTPIAELREHVSLSSGVKMRSGNLDPFISPRLRVTLPLDPWRMDLTQWLFWRRKEGFGERSRVDMRTLLGEKFHFVSSSTATWSESSEGVDLSQSFTVRRMFGPASAIAYRTRADWHTRPSAIVDSYTLGVDYRRLIHRDWLFLDVSPEFRFPNEKDYELTPALTVTLEANF